MGMVEPSAALAHTDKAPDLTPVRPEARKRTVLTEEELWARRMTMASMHAQGKYLRVIAEAVGLSISTVSRELDELIQYYRAEALKSVGEKVAKEEALIYMVQLEAIDAWFASKEGRIVNNKKKVREIRRAFNASSTNGKGRRYKSSAADYGPRNVARMTRDAVNEVFGVSVPQWGNSVSAGQEDPADEVDAAFEVIPSEKEEEYTRTESSPGDPRYLALILECSDRRAKLNGLYPKNDFAGGIGGHGGEDDDFADWTPAMRLTRLASIIEKAKLQKAKQLALNDGSPVTQAQANGNGIPVPERVVVTLNNEHNAMEDWDATR